MLRGAGACLLLPLLDAMESPRVRAQDTPKRFFGFFYPNGRDPGTWDPAAGEIGLAALKVCLTDLGGFAAEKIWPMGDATLAHIAVVTGIDHSAISTDIHIPSMALTAHKPGKDNWVATAPSLDQYLAEKIAGNSPYRSLALSATGSTDIAQGHISWRAAGQVSTVERNPARLFDQLFSGVMGGDDGEAERIRARKASVLDFVRGDAKQLEMRLGAADKVRLGQYFEAIFELEKQLQPPTGPQACAVPVAPGASGDWHVKAKQFIDLAVLAMACDLTRVVTLQYSDSWGVNYSGYQLGQGMESVGTWSDHFLSHKLGDADRATDLDGLDPAEAKRIADARVVQASRFKVRRFAYLVNALKAVSTPTGTLLDDTLAMYVSENGDGDSHSRKNMPILLAGGVGGLKTGRCVAAAGAPTGALHAAVIEKFGIPCPSYGDPAGKPLAGL
jgi:hypothetical protein